MIGAYISGTNRISMAHSPAPWRWEADLNGEDHRLKSKHGSIVINSYTWALPSDPDAALIAAAPEMYEMLYEAHIFIVNNCEVTKGRTDLLIKIRGAIAKADGRDPASYEPKISNPQ